jgi:uncharacterized protein (DUF697 family)
MSAVNKTSARKKSMKVKGEKTMGKASETKKEDQVCDCGCGTTKECEAKSVITKYLLGSMGAAIIPLPVVDTAAIVGVQLKMLHSLSKIYGVPFSDNAGKSVLASLVGGVGAASVARGTFGSLVKLVPIVGPIVGAVTLPVLAGASTYAVGKVFVQHFEAGGTFLDFDPAKVRKYFEKVYSEGAKVAEEVSKSAESVAK